MLGVSGSGFEVSLQEDSEVVIGAFGVVGFYRVLQGYAGFSRILGVARHATGSSMTGPSCKWQVF